jgi:hypothetical protein
LTGYELHARLCQLAKAMQTPGKTAGALESIAKGFDEIEKSFSPRFFLYVKKAIGHQWIAKERKAQVTPEIFDAVDHEPRQGEGLLHDLFDQGYCADLAFVKKLVEKE